MTQTDVANLLGINQGQYSSVEGGTIRISRDYLVKLYTEGWDIDYILVEKSMVVRNQQFQKRLVAYELGQQKSVLRYVHLALVATAQCGQKYEYKNELELLNHLIEREAKETVLYAARKMIGKNQMDMAETLGVSTKKYRRFEKGYSYPDGEVLGIIGRETNCRATLFLGLGLEEWNIVEYIWAGLDKKAQEDIISHVNQEIIFLNKNRNERL